MNEVRMDKWLWAARFFKTRALAAKACELGRIYSNSQPATNPRPVRNGDMLEIKTPGGHFEVEVLGLSEVRGPAPVAHALYRETETSQKRRQQEAEARKAMPQFEPVFAGKPSKKNRRDLDRLRGRL